jgi:hypothetical protein
MRLKDRPVSLCCSTELRLATTCLAKLASYTQTCTERTSTSRNSDPSRLALSSASCCGYTARAASSFGRVRCCATSSQACASSIGVAHGVEWKLYLINCSKTAWRNQQQGGAYLSLCWDYARETRSTSLCTARASESSCCCASSFNPVDRALLYLLREVHVPSVMVPCRAT